MESIIAGRAATPEDAREIDILYEKVWNRNYPWGEEDINETTIRENIISGEEIWWVALDGENVVAAAACRRKKWNNSAEFGIGMVHPSYRGKGVSLTENSRKLVELTFEKGVDMCIGRPRVSPVWHIVRKIGFEISGYLPPDPARDAYLLCIKPSEACKQKRFTPPERNSFYERDIVKEIYGGMGLEDRAGKYPEEVFAGDPKNINQEGPIKCQILPNHRSLLVLGSDPNPSQEELMKNLDIVLALSAFKDNTRYVEMDVLADKIKLLENLEERGFELTGFLPAWMEKDGKRYDCFKMVRYNSPDPFIETRIKALRVKLARK